MEGTYEDPSEGTQEDFLDTLTPAVDAVAVFGGHVTADSLRTDGIYRLSVTISLSGQMPLVASGEGDKPGASRR